MRMGNVGKTTKNLYKLHSDLPFLTERKKINKCSKLINTLHNKKTYYSYKSIKTSIKSWIKTNKGTQSNII